MSRHHAVVFEPCRADPILKKCTRNEYCRTIAGGNIT